MQSQLLFAFLGSFAASVFGNAAIETPANFLVSPMTFNAGESTQVQLNYTALAPYGNITNYQTMAAEFVYDFGNQAHYDNANVTYVKTDMDQVYFDMTFPDTISNVTCISATVWFSPAVDMNPPAYFASNIEVCYNGAIAGKNTTCGIQGGCSISTNNGTFDSGDSPSAASSLNAQSAISMLAIIAIIAAF